MQRKLFKMCLWIAIIMFQLTAVLIHAGNVGEGVVIDEPKEEVESQELVFLVSPQDLHFDQENITVCVNGSFHLVYSLKRQGNQWIAKVAGVNYCPKGHLTCNNCGQCHTEKCWYFVRHCKLW